jgi:arginyl-tRNA synthetase
MIADDVAKALADKNGGAGSSVFSKVDVVKPGFLNLDVRESFLQSYLQQMAADDRLGMPLPEKPEKIIIDYGGPNVAKPLHVGHLRSAVIGESVKRIARFHGEDVIGDIHLGDWGLQMGLVITELKKRMPELPYFDESFEGEYPSEAPFTISELEEIYPTASAKSKENKEFSDAAHQATAELQQGRRGYRAIWNHIMNVSKADLKKNYDSLNVHFEVWKGESDAQPVIPSMLEDLINRGIAYESQGALVIDVTEPTDKKEIPPCIVRKSDGASIYATSDLATIISREKDYAPAQYIYVVDNRQEMYFKQVFRSARKAGFVKPETDLKFLGFGTMNGKDGKPFKTRSGGVYRLEFLIKDVQDAVLKKILENRTVSQEEAEETAKIVALSAIKFGDLSNAAVKDYIFDIDRFTSFEGKTGPYILYTLVRIKSILAKLLESGELDELEKVAPGIKQEVVTLMSKKQEELLKGAALKFYTAGLDIDEAAKDNKSLVALVSELSGFAEAIEAADADIAPHKLCAFIYELSDAFNSFYHENRISGEQDKNKQALWVSLLELCYSELSICIELLGFNAPDRM